MEQEKNLNSAQKVVSLAEALRSKKEAKKSREEQDVTFERIDAIMTDLRNKIAFWRAYPDLFVDLIKGKDCTFKFYFYQRVFLRAAMRYRYVYATYPRALI